MRRQQEQTPREQEPYDFYKPMKQEPITFRGEMAKLKKMSFKDKAEYIWNNYTAYVIVIFMLIIAVAILGNFIYQKTRPAPYLTVGILDYDGYSEALEQQEIMTDEGEVEHLITNVFQGTNAESIISGASQDTVMGLTAMVTAGDLDGIIASGDTIRALQKESGDFFYSLEDQFSENELAWMQDRLLYMTSENGEEYPVAVNLSGMSALSGMADTPEDIYVAFTYNTRNAPHLRSWIFQQLGYFNQMGEKANGTE